LRSAWHRHRRIAEIADLRRISEADDESCLRVKALTGIHNFGAGLADDEVVYLTAVIRRALAGRP